MSQYCEKNGVRLLSVAPRLFSPEAEAWFTTRVGGVSTGAFSSLNLSTRHDDAPENVEKNFLLACEAMGLDSRDLIFAQQKHTAECALVTARDVHRGRFIAGAVPGVDALITSEIGPVLTVRTADCVPVFLSDRRHGAIAAIHSGWRGTLHAITLRTLERMRSEFGTEGIDVCAAVGPCICADCFEVDPPVADEFIAAYGMKRLVRTGPKYHIDLAGHVLDQLTRFGVPETQIEAERICTAHHTDLYFSHRAEHGYTGGMCGFIRRLR